MNAIFCIAIVTLLFRGSIVAAFSIADHRIITELAIEELRACNKLPKVFLMANGDHDSPEKIIIDANLEEDKYRINGFKKLFVFSHFFNPMRPLQPEARGRDHAGFAVEEYTEDLLLTKVRKKSFKKIGQLAHFIQDASSAPHVLSVNHGISDGFEQKVKIAISELQQTIPCEQISLNGLKTPLEIMKAAAIATMKELDNKVEFKEESDEEKVNGGAVVYTIRWSESFYSNPSSYTERVHDFLASYDFLSPNLNTPTKDDDGLEGWNLLELEKGKYGPMSVKKFAALRGDNFGKPGPFELQGKQVYVSEDQYENLKKTLMRQAILSTQRLIIWSSEHVKLN